MELQLKGKALHLATTRYVLHHLGVHVSGVFHSLDYGIQCIVDRHMNGALFQGDQVVKSCYQDGCVTCSCNGYIGADLHFVVRAHMM